MKVRCYQSDDTTSLARLFTESVHSINTRDYSCEQIAAWAPAPPDIEHWHKQLGSHIVFLAEHDSDIVGFITFEPDGHLDHLYVPSYFHRQGVASALYRRVEQEAFTLGVSRIFTEASITAVKFFESVGFRVIVFQQVERGGIPLKNYQMEKLLPKSIQDAEHIARLGCTG